MLTSLGGAIISAISGGLLDKVTGVFEAYFRKEITKEQLHAQLTQAMFQTFAEVEKAYAQSIAQTYATLMSSVVQNQTVRLVWTFTTLTQVCVLLWHQVGIPLYSHLTGERYPSSGTTVEWAYALVAGLLGLGALALRGSSPTATADKLKSMVAKR